MKEQERRAEEARQAKLAADEEWRRAQRERELQRKAEEEALEREAKVEGRRWWPGERERCGWGGCAVERWHRRWARAARVPSALLTSAPAAPPPPRSPPQVQDAERHRREMELLRREAEEEKRRRQEAYERCALPSAVPCRAPAVPCTWAAAPPS